jgi:hypothetical protein
VWALGLWLLWRKHWLDRLLALHDPATSSADSSNTVFNQFFNQ